ncbi:MAG: hypothetical protein VX587_00155, partial [Thermoproteota archaeon]|nr:hypothetical protein [Thermoproteota archaeon]
MSGKSKEEILAEYEKDYLERLSKKGEDSQDVESINEEERAQKVKEAERLQNESAAQIQAAQKKKEEFDKEVSALSAELRLLKEMATLTGELESLKKQIKSSPKRKVTRKKAVPKRKVTRKKAVPKRKVTRK